MPVKLLPPAEAGIGAELLLTSLYVHNDGGFSRVVQPHDEEGHLPGEGQQRVSIPEKACALWGPVAATGPWTARQGTLPMAAAFQPGEGQDGDTGSG